MSTAPWKDALIPLKPPSAPRVVRADLPLLEAVISGGQTGTDQAGLRAARALGLATGGTAPRGFRTIEGPAPWLGTEFGLVEHWSPEYPPRTIKNVADSDATLRFAAKWCTPGEICTLRAIKRYDKPHLDVQIFEDADTWASAIFKFLVDHKVRVLNVAGNSERAVFGISHVVGRILEMALRGPAVNDPKNV